MSKSRKVDVVDSYATIKALKLAPAAPAPVAPAELRPVGAGKTVQPPKRVIECYECGYKFQLHGRAAATNCNKCRVTLDLTDHIVAQRWSGTIKTCGLVRILPNGFVESGTILANDLILEGVIEAGDVRVIHRLEVRRGSQFTQAHVKATDILIAEGAVVTLPAPAEYRHVELAGTLHATLRATGLVTIQPRGLFQGALDTHHLVVEDGGGLEAAVQLTGVEEPAAAPAGKL